MTGDSGPADPVWWSFGLGAGTTVVAVIVASAAGVLPTSGLTLLPIGGGVAGYALHRGWYGEEAEVDDV